MTSIVEILEQSTSEKAEQIGKDLEGRVNETRSDLIPALARYILCKDRYEASENIYEDQKCDRRDASRHLAIAMKFYDSAYTDYMDYLRWTATKYVEAMNTGNNGEGI